MAVKETVIQALQDITNAFPRQPLPEASQKLYQSYMVKQQDHILKEAIQEIIETSRFMPTIAEINEKVRAITGIKIELYGTTTPNIPYTWDTTINPEWDTEEDMSVKSIIIKLDPDGLPNWDAWEDHFEKYWAHKQDPQNNPDPGPFPKL